MNTKYKIDLANIFTDADEFEETRKKRDTYTVSQQSAYLRLLNLAASISFENGSIDRNSAADMRDTIRQLYHSSQGANFDMPHVDVQRIDGWISEVEQSARNNDKEESSVITAFIVAAVMSECSRKPIAKSFRQITFEPDIITAQGQYTAYKTIAEIEASGSVDLLMRIKTLMIKFLRSKRPSRPCRQHLLSELRPTKWI